MYKQTIPATDWFYVVSADSVDDTILYRVAAWALREDDSVVGLISDTKSQRYGESSLTCLAPAPCFINGLYKHQVEPIHEKRGEE